jgi:hypothetical protein
MLIEDRRIAGWRGEICLVENIKKLGAKLSVEAL